MKESEECNSYLFKPGDKIEDVERKLIEITLADSATKAEAASKLGICLKTLYNRLNAYKNTDASIGVPQ